MLIEKDRKTLGNKWVTVRVPSPQKDDTTSHPGLDQQDTFPGWAGSTAYAFYAAVPIESPDSHDMTTRSGPDYA